MKKKKTLSWKGCKADLIPGLLKECRFLIDIFHDCEFNIAMTNPDCFPGKEIQDIICINFFKFLKTKNFKGCFKVFSMGIERENGKDIVEGLFPYYVSKKKAKLLHLLINHSANSIKHIGN